MEEKHVVEVLALEWVTHNVRRVVIKKPKGYKYIPGQATEVAVNKPKWKDELRPFTFTSLNNDENLEFTIKVYNDHDGVTRQIGKLEEGDEIILHDVWGTINYDGPGYFIAGGAGITPFISIFRMLEQQDKLDDHYLIYSNKTKQDIILRGDFTRMLGDRFINTLTDEKVEGYDNQLIDQEYLKSKISDFNQNFYLCGPKGMVKAMREHLEALGASVEAVVYEK